MISSSSSTQKRSTSPERPLTPRRRFIQDLIPSPSFCKTLPKAIQIYTETTKEYLERARNSHNAFCKTLNITPETGAFAAFPRYHTWTELQKLTPDGINPQDLASRIMLSFNTPQEELWKKRQEFIGQETLKFLLGSGIMPKNTKVVADLFCETGGFLVALKSAKEKGKIKYDTAYGIDVHSFIKKIAERWNVPHKIHTKDIDNMRDEAQPKADFIYLSAPVTVFKDQQEANETFKGIRSYAQENSKIFFGLAPILNESDPQTKTLTNAMGKYFDSDLITAEDAEKKGWCEKDRLIADTYGGCLILTPKKQDASSSHPQQQAPSSKSKKPFGGMRSGFLPSQASS